MLLQLGVQWPEVALIMAAVIAFLGSIAGGVFLVVSNRKPKSSIRYDADTTPVGETPTAMWLNQFAGIQRGQNYILAVLVGQGIAFFAFALSMRQEFVAKTQRTDERLDHMGQKITQLDDGAVHLLQEIKETIGRRVR